MSSDTKRVGRSDALAELVVWSLPRELPGAAHSSKYQLAELIAKVEFVSAHNDGIAVKIFLPERRRSQTI